jgi:aromatic ring-opening dioxygenase catalytic subunit (LigB family)
MAELVGVFAASHTPVMLNFPDAIPDQERAVVFDAFQSLGAALRGCRPDVVVVISDDHLHNFFLDNFPAFCIGAAPQYATPIEHWLKAPKSVLPGDTALGAYLLQEALAADFDPAFSMELTLDHGVLTPLELAGITSEVRVVPIMINCVQPPFPSMRRCLQWGRFLGDAIASYPGDTRIAVLATGGLSHDIATPRMGLVNEDFDRRFLDLLAAGDNDALVRYATDHVHEAGNGAEEIRTWLLAHGAARGARFATQYYKAVGNWYTGIGIGAWDVGS